MPRLHPFRGVRYDAAAVHGDQAPDLDLSAVVAPPYDVVDDAERAELARRHPANCVRLILPEGAGEGGDRYTRAAAQWAEWQRSGVLGTDDAPALYPYRMEYHDELGRSRSTTGVLGALELPDESGGDGILPHERTLPKAKSDRLALLRATRANFDPIWGLSGAVGLTRLLDLGAPIATAVDDDGTRHVLGRIVDPDRVEAVTRAVAGAPLVLADGHHRFETALAYRDENPSDRGAAAILCLVVELADDELDVRPIHRVIPRLPADLDLPAVLGSLFEARTSGGNTTEGVRDLQAALEAVGGLGLVLRDRLVHLTAWPGALSDRLARLPEPLRGVDSAVFELAVQPALQSTTVRYEHGANRVAEMVRYGEAEAAVLLRAVGVETIRAAAEAGVRMPQKTTFFAPKPRTGMVMRNLDSGDGDGTGARA